MIDWIDAGGVTLRYDLAGTGASALVLVHEMGGTLESWDYVLPDLARGRRVLRYDTRGAGQSEKARGNLTFDIMADDLAGLLQALGITGKVALAGCAVGAGIALRFAARFPGQVAALVAMSPALGLDAERREAALARAAQAEREGMRAVVEQSFAGSYPPQVRHDAEQFRKFRARWLANDPASYAAIYRMLAGSAPDHDPPLIACPTLVVAGTHDLLRPPAVVEPIARAITGAHYRILDTGHFMATQTPGPVGVAIGEFLLTVGC